MTKYIAEVETIFTKRVVIETDITNIDDLLNEVLEREDYSLDNGEFDTNVSSISRLAICPHNNTEIIQVLESFNDDDPIEGAWLCLHNEEEEEDAKAVARFKEEVKSDDYEEIYE